MYLTDRSHRTAGWVAVAHVCAPNVHSAPVRVTQKSLAEQTSGELARSLNLYIALLRSRLRGAAIADRRHELGGALSAGAVAGEQCNRGIMQDRGIM